MWIGHEYRNIAVGDQMIIEEQNRWRDDAFSRGKIARFTDNYFWIGSDRFSRSMGRKHGDQRTRAYRFNQEKWDELVERKNKAAAKKQNEQDKRRLEELQTREDFGCDHITDEDAQSALSMLRHYVIGARNKTKAVLEAAGEASPDKPWPLYHQLRDRRDHETFITNVRMADLFADIHQRLVGTVDAFEDGQAFEQRINGVKFILSKAEGTTLKDLIRMELRSIAVNLAGKFVDKDIRRDSYDEEIGQQHILQCLMNAADWRYSNLGWSSFRKSEED